MAVVGCLGDIVFQVSRETVRTIDNVVWSGSARYGVHHKHLGNALTEFTGLDPDKISFTMLLSKGLGAADREPRAAFVELDFLEDGDGLRPLVTVEILEEED